MSNPTIEVDIAEILKELQKGQKDIQITLEAIKGDIKSLDTKVEQLDKRLANQEFINRGVLVGLIAALLAGVAKVFGFVGNI
ncbi:hypothetical protein Xen7305DRAFT_00021790 [Xenococcus sp. PCC 7305]|uniref:hypothetical protein n=1 Tax=Xenococcus sp. PCC 7305 TaxID=102125 RepID=UPI0002AC79C6|nr:hypothetical protein [Xenococcus sp. PCC 7305]ELS02465.1 hypothetical protein Xen7305DRAFT_00021790 [Xenococcus sp. PCC 7305]